MGQSYYGIIRFPVRSYVRIYLYVYILLQIYYNIHRREKKTFTVCLALTVSFSLLFHRTRQTCIRDIISVHLYVTSDFKFTIEA